MNTEFRVKFWGVRGSYPTPRADALRYGGNTPCVEISAGGRTIILDAGTGIIPLGRELALRVKRLEALILLSHLHHDHTQGFPFFAPAYNGLTTLHIFGPDDAGNVFKRILNYDQSARMFPVGLNDMSATKKIYAVRESRVIVWDGDGVRLSDEESENEDAVNIRARKSYGHPGHVWMYRISYRGKALVYATDTEGYAGLDRNLANFARGADLLIHDAQYSEEHYCGMLPGFPATQGYGHSTAKMAAEMAVVCEVNELILFHHEPAYSDEQIAAQEDCARKIFEPSRAAQEGLEALLADAEREVKYETHG